MKKPLDTLVNIIAILLIVILSFVYANLSGKIDTAREATHFYRFIRDTIPSINAALVAYLCVYYFFFRLGILNDQQLKEEIVAALNQKNDTRCNYECQHILDEQKKQIEHIMGSLSQNVLSDSFQQKLIVDLRELVHSTSLQKRMEDAGISNFFSSRDDYIKYRIAPKLFDLLNLANKEIYISAHWMAHGTEIEGVPRKIVELTKSPKNLNLIIAVVDPKGSCIKSLANYFGMQEEEVTSRIKQSLNNLYKARQSLSESEKTKFVLKVYDALPVASVIMIDPYESDGRLQIDIKPYKTDRQNSFSFELKNWNRINNSLYSKCRDAWIRLINDSKVYDPIDYT